MSAKHLARLRAQQALQPAVQSDSDSGSQETEDEQLQQPKFNLFDLIQDEDDSADEADVKCEEDGDSAATPPEAEAAAPPQPAVPPQRHRQTASKPAGKHKGGKAAAKAGAGGRGGKGGKAAQQQQGDADIDQLLQDFLNVEPRQVCTHVTATCSCRSICDPLLHPMTLIVKMRQSTQHGTHVRRRERLLQRRRRLTGRRCWRSARSC